MRTVVSKNKTAVSKLLSNMERRRPTLGCDPEFFITTKKGKTLSACQFLPSKFDKKGVKRSDGHKVGEFFFDGVQGEMNVNPSSCREILSINIWRVLNSIKRDIGSEHKLAIKPSVVVAKEILDRADPEAKRFGCSPDWNAYTGLQNESKLNGDTHRVRYSGGHIHLGFGKEDRMLGDPKIFLDFVKLLDLIVAIPMLLLDIGPASNRRRKHYGKAGTFRETKWGLEYRQPSNIWLKSPELASLAWGLTRTAYRIMISAVEDHFWNIVKPEEVQEAIDSSDHNGCVEIYKRIKKLLASASLSDDPFYSKHGRYIAIDGKYHSVFVAGSDVYDYVMDKTVDEVYGPDCEKAWHVNLDVDENGVCPRAVYSGFIEGTLDKIEGDSLRKIVNVKPGD